MLPVLSESTLRNCLPAPVARGRDCRGRQAAVAATTVDAHCSFLRAPDGRN